jgi:TolA-binding protein
VPVEPPSTDPVTVASAPPQPSGIAEEIAVIDRAREALRQGDPTAAGVALADHRARFGEGLLTPEAELLRIQLLVAQGRRDEAAIRGRAFLATHPTSPLAARVRKLVADSSAAPSVGRFPEETSP